LPNVTQIFGILPVNLVNIRSSEGLICTVLYLNFWKFSRKVWLSTFASNSVSCLPERFGSSLNSEVHSEIGVKNKIKKLSCRGENAQRFVLFRNVTHYGWNSQQLLAVTLPMFTLSFCTFYCTFRVFCFDIDWPWMTLNRHVKWQRLRESLLSWQFYHHWSWAKTSSDP